jgi:hypothetical protein
MAAPKFKPVPKPIFLLVVVVVVNGSQPPDAGIVYDTVYVPGVLAPGMIFPLIALIFKPEGVAEKLPPGVPVIEATTGSKVELQ